MKYLEFSKLATWLSDEVNICARSITDKDSMLAVFYLTSPEKDPLFSLQYTKQKDKLTLFLESSTDPVLATTLGLLLRSKYPKRDIHLDEFYTASTGTLYFGTSAQIKFLQELTDGSETNYPLKYDA